MQYEWERGAPSDTTKPTGEATQKVYWMQVLLLPTVKMAIVEVVPVSSASRVTFG